MLNVTGTADLNGALVLVIPAGTTNGTTFPIITAGQISGAFLNDKVHVSSIFKIRKLYVHPCILLIMQEFYKHTHPNGDYPRHIGKH